MMYIEIKTYPKNTPRIWPAFPKTFEILIVPDHVSSHLRVPKGNNCILYSNMSKPLN